MGVRLIPILLLLLAVPVPAQMRLGNPFFTAAVLKPSATAASFPSSPARNWNMNEASGTRADSIAATDFTESGGTVGAVTGINGDAANWNAAAGILTSGAGFGDFGLPMSFTFWLNIDNAPASATEFCNPDGDGDPYVRLGSDRTLTFGTDASGDVIASSALSLDTWHNVTMTVSAGTTWKVYVDGTLIGTDVLTPNGVAIVFGTVLFDGAIDAITHWGRELTSTEVGNIWNGGTGTFYTP